jgi:hypothetical protein
MNSFNQIFLVISRKWASWIEWSHANKKLYVYVVKSIIELNLSTDDTQEHIHMEVMHIFTFLKDLDIFQPTYK